jgi:tripartite-type tricarboxylate transporter receptor subunit TctC
MGQGGQGLRHEAAVIRIGRSRAAGSLQRRELLRWAAFAAALAATPRTVRAQAYPARPVRLIVGLAPGGGQDIVARLMGQWLSERLGRQFIVENRPGASGNLALEAVASAPPDGYTLAQLGVNNAINASLYNKPGFQFLRDIAPIAGIMRVPLVMVVLHSFPATTVPEFIAYAKANPGKINMGSGGVGTSIHVSGELFKLMTGIDMLHVPYRGGALAMKDLIGGQVHVMFDTMPESISLIRAGTIRPLAVTTTERASVLPEVPTVGQFLPGYEASAWYGIGAPRNTPLEIVHTINREINAGLADPKIKTRLADLGGTIIAGSPADFGKLLANEVAKWAKVIEFAGVKPE